MQWLLLLVGTCNFALVLFGIANIRKTNFLKDYFVRFAFILAVWSISFVPSPFIPSDILIKMRYACMPLLLGQGLIIVKSFSLQRKVRFKEISFIYALTFTATVASYFVTNMFERPMTEPHYLVYTVMFLTYTVLYGAALLFIVYNMGVSDMRFKGDAQRQARYMFLGIAGFASTEFIAAYILPLCGYAYLRSLSVLGSLFFIGCNVYAILRYNLLDVHIIVKRSTVYSIMALIIVSVYFGTSFLFDYIGKYVVNFNAFMYRTLAGIIIAFLYIPTRKRIEELIDKLLFPNYYTHTKAVQQFSERLTALLDLRELVTVVVENMLLTFNIECGALYLYDKEQKKFLVRASKGFDATTSTQVRDIDFTPKCALVQWLTANKTVWIRDLYLDEESAKRGYRTVEEKTNVLKAQLCVPLLFDEKLIGFIPLGQKTNGEPYLREEINLIETLEYEIAVSLINALSYHELKQNYVETIASLAKAIEVKDKHMRGHAERVQDLAVKIAKAMHCSRYQIELLKYAGMLHDIGKISIDDDILSKAEPLSPEEYELVKTHPVAGAEIVAPIEFFDEIQHIIRHHHERWDGEGYPDHLKGEDIVLLCRILQVADSLDAMMSPRSYRNAKTLREALQEFRRCTGSQFDPTIVDCVEQLYKAHAI